MRWLSPTSVVQGSADKATRNYHSEELEVENPFYETTTGNSPSRIPCKKTRGSKQRLIKRQERLKSGQA
jgi:hypothetical protein